MVAPLLELLVRRLLQRRADPDPPPSPTRLVSRQRTVDTLGVVADRTSVLRQRPGAAPDVLPAGTLLWPPLLPGTAPTYVVVTHEPVEVWLRVGPFDTLDGRTVHQVELRLQLTLADAPSALQALLDADARTRGVTTAGDPGALDGLGERVLERLAREVTSRTSDAVRRRTLQDLTGLSLGVLLDETLPPVLLDGVATRSAVEVVDVDWPTEGRGWPRALAPAPGGTGAALPGPGR